MPQTRSLPAHSRNATPVICARIEGEKEPGRRVQPPPGDGRPEGVDVKHANAQSPPTAVESTGVGNAICNAVTRPVTTRVFNAASNGDRTNEGAC